MSYYNPGYAQQPTQPALLTPPRILISHSSFDKEFCDIFVEFLVSLGFTNDTIIYTSKSEFAIPIGKDIYDYLRFHLNREIWIFFMLSHNFYKSPACLNEMGAVWIKQNKYYSVLLPNFEHSDIKGVLNRNQHTLDLCDPVRLTELLNLFKQTWKLRINNTMWEASKNSFITKMTKLYI